MSYKAIRAARQDYRRMCIAIAELVTDPYDAADEFEDGMSGASDAIADMLEAGEFGRLADMLESAIAHFGI